MKPYLGRHRCSHSYADGHNHLADGWIVSPDGKRISVMCEDHAQECIDEYRQKLGEGWAFEEERREQ